MYPNQYEQNQYANNTNMYQEQPPPMYQSIPNQQFPVEQQSQPQYFDNSYMNQQQLQPQYFDNTYMNQQPQYADNTYTNQQPQPMYQTVPQQPPPPSYAMSVQSPSYSAPVQQQQPQFQNSNSNVSSNNQAPQGTPFSKGYKWPRQSIQIICPQCGATIKTRVDTSISLITVLGAACLFFFTCILVFLPFCIPACKKTIHYCPNCNSALGTRKPLR